MANLAAHRAGFELTAAARTVGIIRGDRVVTVRTDEFVAGLRATCAKKHVGAPPAEEIVELY
jgi:hypothetical protein